MADPFCSRVEGRTGCTSCRLFFNRGYSVVVRHGNRSALRNGWEVYEAPGVQSVFLSQEQAFAFFTIIRCRATAPVAIRFP